MKKVLPQLCREGMACDACMPRGRTSHPLSPSASAAWVCLVGSMA